MLASMSPERNRWSEVHEATLLAYNRTVHSVTKFPPGVVHYVWLCSTIEEVPVAFRDLVALELKTYDSWNSMKAIIMFEVKVTFP